ncbi:hypothetical protein [Methylobrevis albus]|uniref:Uncharacterized protein n=1 Tax=Methylobrevis albus TaxID=2793297 RepID=A0A931I2U6_9HYPH|nr:hypothetical protein [Methylobrevis albus]MBH0238246.1 hypothetical protein [Methylobrevis albus]
MFKVVNGFACTSGCDVAVAKKGVDPRNPRNDPVKQEMLDAKDPAKAARKAVEEAREARLDPRRSDDPAVVYGGALAGRATAATSTAPAGVGTASPLGSRLDILV